MKILFRIIGFFFLFGILIFWLKACVEYEKNHPDDEGSHWNYSIFCEGGFKYKRTRHAVILMLNSDGTPLKCNQKRY